MPRPRRETDAALQELYDEIPDIPGCKGLCWHSCGPIEASDRERQRLAQAGFKLPSYTEALLAGDGYWCPALGPDGRCQAYAIRPLICHAWGAVEGLKCPWGCEPEGGWLPNETMDELIREAFEIGGGGEAFQAEVVRLRDVLGVYAATSGDKARAIEYGAELPEVVRKRKARKPGRRAVQ